MASYYSNVDVHESENGQEVIVVFWCQNKDGSRSVDSIIGFPEPEETPFVSVKECIEYLSEADLPCDVDISLFRKTYMKTFTEVIAA